MPRNPKVYTVCSYLIDRKTGKEKKVYESQRTVDADGNVAIINEKWLIPKEEWQAYLDYVGEVIAENLPEATKNRLLEVRE